MKDVLDAQITELRVKNDSDSLERVRCRSRSFRRLLHAVETLIDAQQPFVSPAP